MTDRGHAASERDFFRGRVDAAFTGPQPAAWEARKAVFDALSAAHWAAGADPSDPGLLASVRDIAQLGVIVLESVRGSASEVPYRGRLLSVPGGISVGEFDAGLWSRCLFAATAAQDAPSAVRLSRVRFDAFSPGRPSGQAELAMILATIWAGDSDIGGHLVAALEKTDPDGLSAEDADSALNLVVPQAAVLDRISAGESADTPLAEAANRYVSYWSGTDPEELLALELCGLVVLSRLLGQGVHVSHAVLAPTLTRADLTHVTACPLCAEPYDGAELRCAWCGADLTADAPLEMPLDLWLQEQRLPCGECGSLVHAQAVRCWSCGTRC